MKYVLLILISVFGVGCASIYGVNDSYHGRYQVSVNIFAYPKVRPLIIEDGKVKSIAPIKEEIKWIQSMGEIEVRPDSNPGTKHKTTKAPPKDEEICSARGQHSIGRDWAYSTTNYGRCYISAVKAVCNITTMGNGYVFKNGYLIESGDITPACPDQVYLGNYNKEGRKIQE